MSHKTWINKITFPVRHSASPPAPGTMPSIIRRQKINFSAVRTHSQVSKWVRSPHCLKRLAASRNLWLKAHSSPFHRECLQQLLASIKLGEALFPRLIWFPYTLTTTFIMAVVLSSLASMPSPCKSDERRGGYMMWVIKRDVLLRGLRLNFVF